MRFSGGDAENKTVDDLVGRIVAIYGRMSLHAGGLNAHTRQRLAAYLMTLEKGGHHDPEDLMVLGLCYLREIEGKSDPVGKGYTGL